jgi:hypothetical protein
VFNITYETWMTVPSGGSSILGRPRKNRELLIGRAGRNAIEREDIVEILADGNAENLR